MGGNKEDGVQGSGSGLESGALFPRLHVKETKRVGPRAPPRNKMALYEQFTFPSNRFVLPMLPLSSSARSTGSTTYAPQPSSYEGSMYRCTPGYGGMPWMPYMAMNTGPPQVVAQPSMNGSCSSTIVDCEGDLRRAPGIPANGGGRSVNRATQGNTRPSTHSIVTSISSKKSRSNDDCTVPVYNEPANTVPEENCSGTTALAVRSDQNTWRAWQQQSDEIANESRPPSVSHDRQVRSPGLLAARSDQGGHSATEGTRDDTGAAMEISTKVSNSDKDGEEEQQDIPVAHKEMMKASTVRRICSERLGSHDRNGRHCNNSQKNGSHQEEASERQRQKSSGAHVQEVSERHLKNNWSQDQEVLEAEGLRHRATASSEQRTVTENNGEVGPQQRKTIHDGRTSEGSQISVSPLSNFVGPATGRKDNTGFQIEGQKSQKYCISSDDRMCSSGENDGDENLSSESPELSHSEVFSDSDESDISMRDIEPKQKKRKVTSRDVVNTIGEQEFWKARRLIQRQQRIFTGQVFELHRLIKVQQLLAASPSLLENGVYEGTLSDTSKPGQAGEKEASWSKTPDTKAPDEGQETNGSETVKHPDNTVLLSTSKSAPQGAVDDSLPGLYSVSQVPPSLNVAPGASSIPWGPQLTNPAVNNWFGAMPTPNGAYMYQPYQGPFHPSQAPAVPGYNGSYRPVVCSPVPMDVPPVAVFGLPGYDQRIESLQDMYKYNAYQQQWQAAMFCPPIPPNPVAPWYGVPPMPYMDPTHRDPSGLYDKMLPGSVPPMPFLDLTQRGPAGFYDKMMPGTMAHMPGSVPPMTYLHSTYTGPTGLYDKMMPSLEPSGHPGYPRPPNQSNAQAGPSSHPMAYSRQSPWTGAVSGQQPGIDGDRFASQAHVSSSPEICQTSFLNLQGPSGKDCQVLRTQHAEADGTRVWPHSGENGSRDGDCGQGYVPARVQKPNESKANDKLSKRTVEDTAGYSSRQSPDGNNPTDSQMGALPLFPLVPVLSSMEMGKSSGGSNVGVIKVVPRAMVATAESAAEILLSIQKQRRHTS